MTEEIKKHFPPAAEPFKQAIIDMGCTGGNDPVEMYNAKDRVNINPARALLACQTRGAANAIQHLSNIGMLRSEEDGVLPMTVVEDDGTVTETITCLNISGGGDYHKNMPRRLRLSRDFPDCTGLVEEYFSMGHISDTFKALVMAVGVEEKLAEKMVLEAIQGRTDAAAQIRVWWIPQIGMDARYEVSVKTVHEAKLLTDNLAFYDLFQLEHNVKPDYCNAGGVEVFEDGEWIDIEASELADVWDALSENETPPSVSST